MRAYLPALLLLGLAVFLGGLSVGAETPHELAISAFLLAWR